MHVVDRSRVEDLHDLQLHRDDWTGRGGGREGMGDGMEVQNICGSGRWQDFFAGRKATKGKSRGDTTKRVTVWFFGTGKSTAKTYYESTEFLSTVYKRERSVIHACTMIAADAERQSSCYCEVTELNIIPV